MNFVRQYKTPIVIACVILGLFVGWFVIKQSQITTGTRKENGLNAEYKNGIIVLSECLDKSRQAAGVAVAQSDKFNEIITNAVSGRYASDTSKADVGRGQLFSAIQEAYPDITQVGNIFDKVLTVVTGCRSDFAGQQKKLADAIRQYEDWRAGFLVRTLAGDTFPGQTLTALANPAKANSQNVDMDDEELTVHGNDALKKMSIIIKTGEAGKAAQTGSLDDQDLFGDKNRGTTTSTTKR